MTARCGFRLGLALAVWLMAATVWAGVTAEVVPREIGLGESALLRVTVDGAQAATVDTAPLKDFWVTPRGRVVGRRGDGDNAAAVAVYRFELSPKQAGELRLPSLTVTLGDRTAHTPPLRLTVRPRPTPPPDLTDREFALDATVSTTHPFVGETFRYTLRLFRSTAVEAAAVTPPAFPDCTVVALPGQRDSELTAGGRTFAVTEVDYLLTPHRPGRVDLAPGEAACREAVHPDRRGGARSRSCAGPPLTVTVRPLPPFPGPGTWSGLVGHVRLTARLEPPGLGVGRQPVLTVTIAGRGNLPDTAPPAVRLPPPLTARALAPQDEGGYGPAGYQGTRTFRALLSALPPAGERLPAIVLTFFDPEQGAYVTVRTEPEAPPTDAAAPPTLPAVRSGDATPPAGPLVLLLALAAPGLFVADGLWRRHRNRLDRIAGLSPAALAEALRRAFPEPDATPAAVREGIDRLERLLYAGRPIAPATMAEAVAAGRRLLRNWGRERVLRWPRTRRKGPGGNT